MKNNLLQLQQLNSKMLRFASLKESSLPSEGWIKTIRSCFGMSLQQLGKKLHISKQAALDIERREKEGSITIKSMREIAQVLDMQFVYGFVPKEDSLHELIEKRAKELATQIVMRTAHTMSLEDQSISQKRIEQAIQEKTESFKKELPKILWD